VKLFTSLHVRMTVLHLLHTQHLLHSMLSDVPADCLLPCHPPLTPHSRWVGSCQDLKEAIKKLDKLLRKVKVRQGRRISCRAVAVAVAAALAGTCCTGGSQQSYADPCRTPCHRSEERVVNPGCRAGMPMLYIT
jgi:hypothetical protein